MESMNLWNKVCKTNPAYTKGYTGKGGFNGTAICAQEQRKNATEQFGVFGIGWGVEREAFEVIKIGENVNYHILAYTANLYFKFDGKKGNVLLASDISLFNQVNEYVDGKPTGKKLYRQNNDIYKKIRTDALTKGLSELGFNSDIFEGKFDDNKYVQEMKKEFKEPDPDQLPIKQQEKLITDYDLAMSDCSTIKELKEVHEKSDMPMRYFSPENKIVVSNTMNSHKSRVSKGGK